MKSIEVAVLNPEVIPSAEKMMVCAARLTQRGHNLFEAIAGAAEGGIDLNEIPEIQSSADVDADVVEET